MPLFRVNGYPRRPQNTSASSFHYSGVYSCLAFVCCLQVHAVIGVLMDDTDPLVTVMKVEKAPQETYADIGGLDNQIQEIKVQ